MTFRCSVMLLATSSLFLIFVATEAISSNVGNEVPNGILLSSKFLNTKGKGKILLYTLDKTGTFHRCVAASKPRGGQITYSVLKNGILIPGRGPYPIEYDINNRGDLIPKESNTCIYKSDNPIFYLRGVKKMLIPVDVFYSGDRIFYVYGGNHLLFSEDLSKSTSSIKVPRLGAKGMSLQLKPDKTFMNPDKTCNGDVTLFLLRSNGVFHRNPPDEFLPNGMRLSYELKDDGSLSPLLSSNPAPPAALKFSYLTGDKGSLTPCSTNSHTLTTTRETTKSFILGEGGVLAPVSEVLGVNRSVNYFFDGRLVHSSNQFRQIYSNSSLVCVNEKSRDVSDTQVEAIGGGPKFECNAKRIVKRDVRYDSKESLESSCPRKQSRTQCAFVYDDKGKRIPLAPHINENGKIAIYKLTCKGHLKRMEPHTEPEFGFEVRFRMLDSFILVPMSKQTSKVYFKYILQENGNLKPVKKQKYTLKKAPASVLYYILGKNKELLPVRLHVLKTNQVEIYYQDCLIYTMPPESGKDQDVFTTLYAPLYAYLNSRLTIIHHDPLPKPEPGATWKNTDKSDKITYPCKNLYLIGPKKIKIKVEIELNENNVPVIYEMDWNGVCHKSPKDVSKNMVLKSYKLLQEGILLPTNETNGYIYLVDKEGNMLPYCYPETKLRAPHGLTVKYVRCKRGILLPVLVEAPGDHVRFSFESTVIYYKKAYTIDEIMELTELDTISTTDENDEYLKENNNFVYYHRTGKTFRRYPQQKVSDYLVNHSGYLDILESGNLEPKTYPTATTKLKIQIEEMGDLIVVEDTENSKLATDFLLAKNGSLCVVDVKKKGSIISIYKSGLKITQINENVTVTDNNTSTTDPMGIYKDPEPEPSNCKSPQQITIPIEEDVPQKEKVTVIDHKKCEQIRKAVKEMIEKDPTLVGTDIEMSDSVMKEIYKMVCKCSKTKCTSELPARIRRQIINMRRQFSSGEDDPCRR